MKSSARFLCAVAVAPALLLSSCVAPYYGAGPHEAAGGVAGAVLGAAAGGIIGHQSGSGLEGAALGGLLGSWLGSAAGYSQDRYYYGPPPPPVYGYGYVAPPPVVVAPSIGYYRGYSGGYCAPRSYCRPRYCW
jgi:hypothetical protein